jgi:hypothetical protein
VLREIITGEWSVDKSKHDFAFRQWLGMPLITQKSMKSGTFFVSVGQYIGSPVKRCARLLASIVMKSCLPLGVTILERQLGYLAL